MALAKEIMQAGVSAGTARALQGQVSSSVSAAGTTRGTATALTKSINYIGTCAAGAGVSLPAMGPNESVIVYNGGANACIVYPPSATVGINQVAVGTGITLGTNTMLRVFGRNTTQYLAMLSA